MNLHCRAFLLNLGFVGECLGWIDGLGFKIHRYRRSQIGLQGLPWSWMFQLREPAEPKEHCVQTKLDPWGILTPDRQLFVV